MSSLRARRRGPEIIGVLLIVIGLVFLLRTLGILRIDWGAIWPLLIIGLGILVVVSATRRPEGQRSASVPLVGAERAEVEMRMGAGRFHIKAGAAPETLVTVESGEDDVDVDVRREGPLARIRLRQDAPWFPVGWWRGSIEWRVSLSGEVPIRLDLGAGAGDFVVDLLGLRVAAARLSVGAAQLRVRLPQPAGDVPVHLTAGAAGVTIEVPPGVEMKVETSGFLSVEGRTETPGYATAADRVTVRLDGGASSVRIR